MKRSIQELTYEWLMENVTYDPSTGILSWRYLTQYRLRKTVLGCEGANGRIYVNLRGKSYLAHRLAWLITYGSWPEGQIDHINGNPGDNRISNLRQCSGLENQQNWKKMKRNTTGYIGVTKKDQYGGYVARIGVAGKKVYIGYFKTAEEAADAYLEAKKKYHKFQPTPRY